MKKYISRKEVQAEPMNELQAVELGYARPNDDDHEWRQGYHILYPDGYHSWCPKGTFEKDYHCAETVLDRIEIEFNELHERVCALERFRYTDAFQELPIEARGFLQAQYALMDGYHSILIHRYNLLKGDEPCPLPCDENHKCDCNCKRP